MAEEYVKCGGCGNDVTPDSDFCPHCGVLFAKNQQCENHPGIDAAGVCIICTKLLCENELMTIEKRFFCELHANVEVREDWAKVFESDIPTDAELAKTILDNAGVRTLGMNFKTAADPIMAEQPLSRAFRADPAKVFVPIPEFFKAMQVLDEWEQADTPEPDTTAL